MEVIGSPVRLTVEKIRKEYKTFENNNSPGPGGMLKELFKHGTNKLFKNLILLFQRKKSQRMETVISQFYIVSESEEAYDHVLSTKLWQMLESTYITIEIIKAVKMLYEQPMTKIITNSQVTPGFIDSKVQKQGCCSLRILFKVYLKCVLKI